MREAELLEGLRETWLNSMVEAMSRGSGTREDWQNQMTRFFSLLLQAVDSGTPSWLDPIISDWSTSLTQTDLEESTNNLSRILEQMTLQTIAVIKENLPPDQALQLTSAVLPCFTHCFETAASLEMQARVTYVSNQLADARLTLEKLDRSKSDFIAVAAHELKTPLTLVEGYAAMLREYAERSAESQAELALLEGIHNGTRRLRAIIDDMIDVSLIDNNLLSLHFQPIWINRLFEILEIEFRGSLMERKQTLEFLPFDGYDEMNFGDPERLIQVFRNVLNNAIKFTPDGGSIWVSGRKLPGFIEITIKDTGIGIAPEDQTIIFHKFSRLGDAALHSSSKTRFKGGGPGLGLHIARGIVEAHGGAIWVESPGFDETACPGSIFHILLPLRNEAPDDKTSKLFDTLKTVNNS